MIARDVVSNKLWSVDGEPDVTVVAGTKERATELAKEYLGLMSEDQHKELGEVTELPADFTLHWQSFDSEQERDQQVRELLKANVPRHWVWLSNVQLLDACVIYWEVGVPRTFWPSLPETVLGRGLR